MQKWYDCILCCCISGYFPLSVSVTTIATIYQPGDKRERERGRVHCPNCTGCCRCQCPQAWLLSRQQRPGQGSAVLEPTEILSVFSRGENVLAIFLQKPCIFLWPLAVDLCKCNFLIALGFTLRLTRPPTCRLLSLSNICTQSWYHGSLLLPDCTMLVIPC